MKFNKRWLFVLSLLSMMMLIIIINISFDNGIVNNGYANITNEYLIKNHTPPLDGKWEFYWDKLLSPEDFKKYNPETSSFELIRVPGSWSDFPGISNKYQDKGKATYRALIKIPKSMTNPAIKINRISRSYKLYINSKPVAEGGKVSIDKSSYKPGFNLVLIDLPQNTDEIELILQVSNFDYSYGGLRESPVIGERRNLEQESDRLYFLQIMLFGGVLTFSVYYFIFFIIQRKNILALLFSTLCFSTAFRDLIWGEYPLLKLFPDFPIDAGVYINFITGFNLMPIIILIVVNIFKQEKAGKKYIIFIIPSLIMNLFLLTGADQLSKLNNVLYLLMLIQMIYIIIVLIKAVLDRYNSSALMLFAVCTMIVIIIFDMLLVLGVNNHYINYTSLFATFIVILSISIVEAEIQSNIKKKLITYNETLIETDKLKDKILKTELAFLQAQIKPHFLYNSLNAIANVCEKDGKKASNLILDLAIYLRGSLEFNQLDKVSSIKKELEFVITYFNIEKARFGNKIKLELNYNKNLDFELPVLILQPLVENSIRHGISKKMEGGVVKLNIRKINNEIFFEITDNGVGIEKEILENILINEKNDKSIGLLNIQNRLLMLYGKGLSINSIYSEWTTVKFSIPERRTNDIKDSSS